MDGNEACEDSIIDHNFHLIDMPNLSPKEHNQGEQSEWNEKDQHLKIRTWGDGTMVAILTLSGQQQEPGAATKDIIAFLIWIQSWSKG